MVNANDEDELEIDEFTALFKRQQQPLQCHTHTDAAFLGLIRHFCPDVVIENDKHLMHVRCTLWDKRGEVITAMHEYLELNATTTSTSVYKAYEFYFQQQRAKNQIAANQPRLIVSKKYFEKMCNDAAF